MKIRLIELFAGIGAQAKALERLKIPFEHYRAVEFDKYAIKSYNAIHGTNFATQDITKIKGEDLGIAETDKYKYIMTYSFPCQDLSLAGKQAGMTKCSGTRSSLLWEVERLLNECEQLPQILLMENVSQVHSKKNLENFNDWCKFLESKGYCNYWQDLNAKNYGIPQNRNRCFMISLLGGKPYEEQVTFEELEHSASAPSYEFPEPFELKLRLKDLLEKEVDEKFYLSETGAKLFDNQAQKRGDCLANYTQRRIITLAHGQSKGANYNDDISPTLDTKFSTAWHGVLLEPTYRIRKLTPLECWRLMGFDDADFYKAQKVNSNTQLYKQAGNSIVVNVLEEIFKNMKLEV